MFKSTAVGVSLVMLGLFGLVLELTLLGGDSPRIESSIDTRAYIGIACLFVSFVGALTILTSVWMGGRHSREFYDDLGRETLRDREKTPPGNDPG